MITEEEFDAQEYIGEPCAHDRHLSCKEEYIIIVKKVAVCTCDCHVTNTVAVDFGTS